LTWLAARRASGCGSLGLGSSGLGGIAAVFDVMLYERVDVCRRLRDRSEAVVYRCWRTHYVVQSADRIRLPVTASELMDHGLRRWELFREEAPDERSASFPTLEGAIQAFDEEFENVWD